MPEREQPLACSLDRQERGERGRHLRVLSDAALVGRSRDASGLELRFTDADGVRESLEELIELEGRCCPFLDFDLAARESELVLRIGGPANASAVIDAFDALTAASV